MKPITILSILLITISAQSQTYYSNNVGVTFSKVWNGRIKQEQFTASNLHITVACGYNYKTWLAEAQTTVAGTSILLLNIHAGKGFSLSQSTSVQLLAGVSDNLLPSFKPFQLTQKFYPTASARLSIKHITINTMYVNGVLFTGFGLTNFKNK